jgi:hypothetical protein
MEILVAKGFQQVLGIDYHETIVPVEKMESIQLDVTIATDRWREPCQMDMKNVFLHGDLSEEIYMEQPHVFMQDSSLVRRLKYTGLSFPIDHFTQCPVTWSLVPKQECMHFFVHTLDMILKNWYLELEVCRGTTAWEDLNRNFKETFKFEYDTHSVDTTLQIIKTNIFTPKDSKITTPLCSVPKHYATIQEVLECYNVTRED